jgi:hypothetical protein
LQLNSGFYYRKFWPLPEALSARKGWSTDEALEMLALAKRHHERQQEYHKALRAFLNHTHEPHVDTPMLVGRALESYRQGNLDTLPVWDDVYEAWVEMKDLEAEGLPKRDREPTYVCSFKVDAAVAWARSIAEDEERPGGILWVQHQEIGYWTYQQLVAAGLPALHCPAESFAPGGDEAIRDPANRDKFIVASLRAHGVGKNLQFHQHAFFVQWPRESTDAEQGVGRVHRKGQSADCVYVDTCNTTEFDHRNFASCLVDALYHQQTTGVRQRVIYGTHDPLPKIYPSGFLRENGFQNQQLTDKQERELRDRFGVTA